MSNAEAAQGATPVGVRSAFAPLYSFAADRAIDLDGKTRIVQATDEQRALVEGAVSRWMIQRPQRFDYCLQVDDIPNEDSVRQQANVLEEALLLLRLFKAGGVGFNVAVFFDPLKPEAMSPANVVYLGLFHYIVWSRPPMPEDYVLVGEEVAGLKNLWDLARGRKLLDESPFRWFFTAYHEPYAHDRFLSNVIALEQILLRDHSEPGSLSYKFRMRGARVLGVGTQERFKEIYKARSAIVHRGATAVDPPILLDSENFLRDLLQRTLRDPRSMTTDHIDGQMLE